LSHTTASNGTTASEQYTTPAHHQPTTAETTTAEPVPSVRAGAVINGETITINDALEILKFLARLESVINTNEDSLNAARIVTPGIGNPTINDALEILKYLARLDSRISRA
jgi:hypothetical protein